jgi:hypothetical protein
MRASLALIGPYVLASSVTHTECAPSVAAGERPAERERLCAPLKDQGER